MRGIEKNPLKQIRAVVSYYYRLTETQLNQITMGEIKQLYVNITYVHKLQKEALPDDEGMF